MPACTQGDDYVDWVGMSLYHFGTTFPYDQNVLPEAQKFTATVSILPATCFACFACFACYINAYTLLLLLFMPYLSAQNLPGAVE